MSDENWGDDPWRAPTLEDGDELLYSEPGRVIKAGTYGHDSNGIDYRSHYFRIVRRGRFLWLLVKHGGGQERIRLDHSPSRTAQFFEPLDSSQRYLLMHLFYDLYKHGRELAERETGLRYRDAFAEGRLKKRKVRNSPLHHVWIEPVVYFAKSSGAETHD